VVIQKQWRASIVRTYYSFGLSFVRLIQAFTRGIRVEGMEMANSEFPEGQELASVEIPAFYRSLVDHHLQAAAEATAVEELASEEMQAFYGSQVDRCQQNAAGFTALYLQQIEETNPRKGDLIKDLTLKIDPLRKGVRTLIGAILNRVAQFRAQEED
jgi:hypothetical protein